MKFTFSPQPLATVPVSGHSEYFPVHRIYCVGLNYIDHAKEMGSTVRETPFFFMKPSDAVFPVPYGEVQELPFPSMTQELHHEIELVVAIGKGGKNISASNALQHIWGYAVGLDMTRRDLQAEAKKMGRPWCVSKGFDLSAPITPIHSILETGPINQGAIYLNVNGVARQSSNVTKLIWRVEEIIEHLSRYYTLQPGDLIFTGTPEGVGPVRTGDILQGGIAGLGEIHLRII